MHHLTRKDHSSDSRAGVHGVAALVHSMTRSDWRGEGIVAVTDDPYLVAVRVRVWGFTPNDARTALVTAQYAPGAHRWKVVEEIESVGPPRTLQLHDPAALAQGANYEWIWADYPAGPCQPS